MYECKDCGRKATKEQVHSAAEKYKDLNAMMQGLTKWQCTLCRVKETERERQRQRGYSTIQLAPTQELIDELRARYDHCIIAFRTIPVKGENEAMEGLSHKGDYRLCQGLALGMVNRIEREIVAACDRRRSVEEGEDL